LHEAIEALESDETIKGALGVLADEFISLKRMEWVEYMRHVSEWEVQRYLEFF
jgi:glutamine synthetase